MKKDIEALLRFKAEAVERLASCLLIENNEAEKLVQLLEVQDIIQIEAPEYTDTPAEVLMKSSQLRRDGLGMVSYKAGNLIVNTCSDWRELMGTVAGAIGLKSVIDSRNPLLLVAGIITWLLSFSNLIEYKISENSTAIILALQQHNEYKAYAAAEQQCMREANEILSKHGYKEMDSNEFCKEIDCLCKIKCIGLSEGQVKLIERVRFSY